MMVALVQETSGKHVIGPDRLETGTKRGL